MTAHDNTTTGRRSALRLVVAALCAVFVAARPAEAQATESAGAIASIERLDAALLGAMKAGHARPFAQRFATLAPVIEQTFDLNAVLAVSVGLGWPKLPTDQKPALAAAFQRYTIASYAANFDLYKGESFQVLPSVRPLGNGEVIVYTKFVQSYAPPVELDYLMRVGPDGWKVVDVLADGTISRVAMQRSEFTALLSTGGAPALTAALQRKVATLSEGALA
jgi:phospholipid transport system substrate-binding protein